MYLIEAKSHRLRLVIDDDAQRCAFRQPLECKKHALTLRGRPRTHIELRRCVGAALIHRTEGLCRVLHRCIIPQHARRARTISVLGTVSALGVRRACLVK
jgi:hypothetical protein